MSTHHTLQTQNLPHNSSDTATSPSWLPGVARSGRVRARARLESVRVRVRVLRVRDADLRIRRVEHGVVALEPPEAICMNHSHQPTIRPAFMTDETH